MNDTLVTKVYGKNLHAFVEKAFRYTQDKRLSTDQLYITYIILQLEKFLRGNFKKLLVNLPSRHLKTFICSVCFPAFALGLDPTLKFMIVAYSEELAEDIVRQIRELMESPWYKSAFKTRISERHSRKDDFAIKGGGRVRAVPVRSVTGKGGDIVIFDDGHNADDWDNDRRKNKVIEAFELLVSRRDGGKMSQMLVVGHRVAEDDLSAHILDRGDFKHICLPLFAPKKMTFDLGHGRIWTLAKGESLRPDAFPPDEIDLIRRHHRGSPFWLYYQQGLGPRGDDFEIKASDFPFLPTQYGRQLPRDVPVVLSVDPAQKTNSTSRNGIHVYAMPGDHYELIQAWADKCSYDHLAKKVEVFARRYVAWFVIIENTARGPDLIDEMRAKLSIPIIPVNPVGTKADRLRKYAPIIRAKRIHIRRSEAVEEATDEIVAYPNSPYDDHVDILTNFLSKAPELSSATPPPFAGHESKMAVAFGSMPTTPRVRTDGIGYARARSIFGGPEPLPDPSNDQTGNVVFTFDGKKNVLIK